MSDEAMKDRMRVTLDLPKEKVEAIDQLVTAAGMDSRKELFNNALSLLNWAVGEARRGRSIMSVDDGEGMMRHLAMPFLDALEAKAQAESRPKGAGNNMSI